MRRTRVPLLVLFFVFAGFVCCESARADELDIRDQVRVEPPQRAARRLQRELILTLPIWVPGFDGSATVGDVDLTTDSGGDGGLGILDDLFDVATELEFALMGAAQYRWGRWSVGFDAFHVTVGNTTAFTLNGAETNTTVRAAIGRLRVGYRFAEHAAPWCSRRRPHVFEHTAYAGLRGYSVSVESEIFGSFNLRGEDFWVDPILGYSGRLKLGPCWEALVNADVGGVGVASDLTWSLLVGVEYRPKRWFSILAAWSLLYVDYVSGKNDGRFGLDMLLAGPHLALSFHF